MICNEKGGLLNFMITLGDIDDHKTMEREIISVSFVFDKLAIEYFA